MKLLIVTGMSGAGKSHALHKLEDLGYFCVDNLPVALIANFVELVKGSTEIERAALGLDSRAGVSLALVYDALNTLTASGLHTEILFLDASDEVLMRRYKETRRNHPLSRTGFVQSGIEEEREQLARLRTMSNYYIDTSDLKPAELSCALENIEDFGTERFSILVESFGYKWGIPAEADLVFDMRFVPNPYWIEELRPQSGKDDAVRDYVMSFGVARDFIDDSTAMLVKLAPHYKEGGKHTLVVSLGCTGGRHRSVCMAEMLNKRLKDEGLTTAISHRDIEKDTKRK